MRRHDGGVGSTVQDPARPPARASFSRPIPLDLKVTERTYSRDNHEFSLCTEDNGRAGWIAWDAYEAKGSRSFLRFFDGHSLGPIRPISDTDQPQIRPLCVPAEDGAVFLWFEKDAETYLICRREVHDGQLSVCKVLHRLPDRAKPAELQAVIDETGALWLAWSQAEKGRSAIEVLRTTGRGTPRRWALTAGTHRDYRPRLVETPGGGIYLAWDAYVNGGYDVYGCRLSEAHAGDVVQISCDAAWESKATLCRDTTGRLWCAWVRWKDALWKDSVLHQKFSVRGATFDGTAWTPLRGPDGGADLAPLHYGLLTDLDRKLPALGHQGRRLHPVLKAATYGGVWLFYEAKADDAANTVVSKGRFIAQHCRDDAWTGPFTVAEGLVYYELPHDNALGDGTLLMARDIDAEKTDHDVDELHLIAAALTPDLPPVPAACRSVDVTHWREVDLPFEGLHDPAGARTQLTGHAQGRYQLIWGDFHVHAVGSIECEGELDHLAHYARDKARIHALTISDNDHFWSHGARKNQRWLSDAEWDANVGNAKAINEPGRFVLFPGYEQTINANHGITGERLLRNHTSVMADDDDMERDLLHFSPHIRKALAAGRRRSCKDIVECVLWAQKKGCFPLPHVHQNWWRLVDPSVQTACDVLSAWMSNIEEYDIYHTYLNEGLKFGFTGSSDGHYRNPGFGGALTGMWVTEISRAGVLDALRERRTYATAGQRILIEFAIDDAFMGETLVVDEDPVLRWRVLANPGEDYRLRVFRDGRVCHETDFTGSSEGEWRERQIRYHRPGCHYYYLAVTSERPVPAYPANVAHALGGKAWSTPIWLETADWIVD